MFDFNTLFILISSFFLKILNLSFHSFFIVNWNFYPVKVIFQGHSLMTHLRESFPCKCIESFVTSRWTWLHPEEIIWVSFQTWNFTVNQPIRKRWRVKISSGSDSISRFCLVIKKHLSLDIFLIIHQWVNFFQDDSARSILIIKLIYLNWQIHCWYWSLS